MPDRDMPVEDGGSLGRSIAEWLGFVLPPECVAGVTDNLAILAGHMARVRATLEMIDREPLA